MLYQVTIGLIYQYHFLCENPAFFSSFLVYTTIDHVITVMCLFSDNDCSKIPYAVLDIYHKKVMDIFVEKWDVILNF